jgi:Uncharacterised protein family (UPF0175)
VDDGPLISLPFPVPFSEWVTSAEFDWSTLAKRPSLAALETPGQELSRSVFEAVVLEAYRERKLSTAQLQRLLGFETGYELDGFLKAHQVWLEYSLEDLKRDREAKRELGF